MAKGWLRASLAVDVKVGLIAVGALMREDLLCFTMPFFTVLPTSSMAMDDLLVFPDRVCASWPGWFWLSTTSVGFVQVVSWVVVL